jgi:cell division protein FtsW (lipid II flippase)
VSENTELTDKNNFEKEINFPVFRPGRPVERKFLFLVTLILASGIYLLLRSGIQVKDHNPVTYGAVIASSFWLLHLYLILTRKTGDEFFLPLTAFLTIMGWLTILRLNPELAQKQMYWIITGQAAFLLWMQFMKDPRTLEDYKYLFLAAAIILQIIVSIFGVEVNGAKLWLRYNSMSFQPIEFIKIFLTLFLVSYLKQNREILEKPILRKNLPLIKYYVLLFVLWGLAESTLIIQKDLGMALLLFGVFTGLFYVTTKKWALTTLGVIMFGAVGYLLYQHFPHVQSRLDMWWNPWLDPDGGGYQLIQGLYSMANGGITGAGLGSGQAFFVPEIHTDFIYVAIAEELGLVGALVILALFVVLIQRMFITSIYTNNEFSCYLSFGLTAMFATQVLIIIGGAVKFIPLTGLTLPFVSYGGSSLVSNFILLGIFMQISGRIKSEREKAELTRLSTDTKNG